MHVYILWKPVHHSEYLAPFYIATHWSLWELLKGWCNLFLIALFTICVGASKHEKSFA